MQAEVKNSSPDDCVGWDEFAERLSADPYDDFSWFHVTVGVIGSDAGDDFQACISTPRAVGRARSEGHIPGLVVDRFDAESVRDAHHNRIESVTGNTWVQIVDELRTFMIWEYEGMANS